MIDHQLQVHEDKNNLMQIDQIGGKAKSMGTIDNLLIDKMILEDAHFHKKNLSCTWVDVKKAQCLKLKKNLGCPYFKSWATKAVNLVALMNPWLPGRKTHTFKCTTQKNIHFCLLSAFNYMLTLHQHNNCKSSCHLV